MSDTCYFQIDILKKDKEKVDEIMFDLEPGSRLRWPEEEDNEDGTVTLIEHEARYGYLDQRNKLAEAGIVFHGQHGAGSCYGECIFACYDKRHVEANAIDYGPVALVNCNGTVDMSSLRNAQNYYQILELVKKYFKEKGAV
jgi:hypothetical protein